MPKPLRRPGPLLRAQLARTLAVALMLAISTAGCNRLFPSSELRDSKRLSDCRWKARQTCHKLAKKDESLDVDECVSEHAWQCATDAEKAED